MQRGRLLTGVADTESVSTSLFFLCKRILLAWSAAIAVVISMASPALAQEKLAIWWEKGASTAEDDALIAIIRRFEGKYRVKVELSLFDTQAVVPAMLAALEAGSPPDVGFGDTLDWQATPLWAFQGKLEDISDVMEPIRSRFDPAALSSTFLYDNIRLSRAFYAFPVRQQIWQIHYWKDMLATAGYTADDIPAQWDAYWDFWCSRVQASYRNKTGTRVFGLGLPIGVHSADTAQAFWSFMDAYNVELISEAGTLQVDDPAVRARLVRALTSYTNLFTRGCTPPSATRWLDTDNDVAFFNRTTVLTSDHNLSLVARYLDDAANKALTAEQRTDALLNAGERIATSGFPRKPDGSAMVLRASVKAGVVFARARNKTGARNFVRFLLEEANLTPLVEASRGRWFPVLKAAQQQAFWRNDPARSATSRSFKQAAGAQAFTTDRRFSVLNHQNLWAKALHRVVVEQVPADQVVDELIARIKAAAGP